MDTYGFETAPRLRLRLTIHNAVHKLKPSDGNPQVDHKKLEPTLTMGNVVGELKPSIGNPQVEHKKSEVLDLDDDPTPEVDYMKKLVFGPSLNKDGMLVCGSFFLEHREQDVVEVWPMLKSFLEEYGISCTMYLAERFMTLSTTSRTKDPDIIYKARDVLELMSFTSVPPSMVMKVLNGNLQHDIIKTGYFNGGLRSKYSIDKKLYPKRCGLLGPSLKELARLSGCSIFDDGGAVTALGTKPQGLKLVRIFVKRCLVNNVRPATILRKVKSRLEKRKRKEESTAGECPDVPGRSFHDVFG